MENQKTTPSEGQISEESLEQVSGGNKAAIEATENATVGEVPEEGAGEKGHLFKFKKKKKFFHHHLHDD